MIFQRAGWFYFFQRINGFNLELSYRFAQGFDKNTVSFDTLKFELTRELIEEATGIAGEAGFWFKKYLLLSIQEISYCQRLKP